MSDTTFRPSPDWEEGFDYQSSSLTRTVEVDGEPVAAFRVTMRLDEYPDAPDFDFGYPVYMVDERRRPYLTPTGYGSESDKASGVDLAEAFSRLDDGINRYGNYKGVPEVIDAIDRWLRVFHGGSLVVFHSSVDRGGADYIAYDTRKMRESWGCEGDALETSAPTGGEWKHYIDNEVFLIKVEQTFVFDEDGDPNFDAGKDVNAVHGFYGETYAQESAEEELDGWVEHFNPETDADLAEHLRATSLVATTEVTEASAGWPVVKVAHRFADVTIYEHTTSDGENYLVVDIDHSAGPDEVKLAVYDNDGALLKPPHRREK